VQSPRWRWAPFFDALHELFDLPEEQLIRIAVESADETQWEAAPLPGVRLFHLTPGPRVVATGADAGIVSMAPGLVFPEHHHLGEERMLILRGGLRESSGAVFRPGDLIVRSAGTSHGFDVLPDQPLLHALVLVEGIELGGMRFPAR
jgi:anti-sigma factor ChrR (cupin superfamily)